MRCSRRSSLGSKRMDRTLASTSSERSSRPAHRRPTSKRRSVAHAETGRRERWLCCAPTFGRLGRVIRLRNGCGWVDITRGECELPPDGEAFTFAEGAPAESARWFHVVEVPQSVAVVRDSLDAAERARIAKLLSRHVEHVAFVHEDRDGFAAIGGEGPPAVLATAVAALKAIGGWDESVPISIAVDSKRFDVHLTHDGHWSAEVEDVTPQPC